MKTITGVPAASLPAVLASIKEDGLEVLSITPTGATFTVVYGPPATVPLSATIRDVSAILPDRPPVANMDQSTPPPPGPAGEFVHARSIAPKTILYTDADGRDEIREGGSRAWRNCNPGNIRKGDFSLNAGAIGDDGSFAVFPSEAVGMSAIISLLRTAAYINRRLRDAIFRYAPPFENDSDRYAAQIRERTGIPLDAILADLRMDDFRKIAKTIQHIEGWQPGSVRANAPPAPRSSTGVMSSAVSATQDWMTIARREASLPLMERSQWDDPGENPRILNYFRVCAAWFEPEGGDEVDWCAAFVNYCLVTSGFQGTDHPGARSFYWNKKDQFIRLPAPIPGAIAVRRYAPFTADWETGPGHVGFLVSSTSTTVTLLGGNQSRTVRETTFPLVEKDGAGKKTSEFVAFMMPAIM